jgi:phosphatidylserine/phosphatidylglycerophosphate/cardiolipin synthase-like enzyme
MSDSDLARRTPCAAHTDSRADCRRRAPLILRVSLLLAILALPAPASAADQIYFPATDNVTNILVQRINAETVRIDMSAWYLTEHAISIALVNRFRAGVPVRLIGDRGSIFEIDANTRNEFYWLASQGVPIRLRYNPTWYPEIDHWKCTIFAGQNLVTFGSANYTPFELAPVSSTNYKDETVLFTDDPALVNAFRTKFDQYWNDTRAEPQSMGGAPPYFKNWNDACALESACADYRTRYPNPAPMVINTQRLEPDYPLPSDMVWGQGPDFNNRLVQEINAETARIDFVIYRLTVDNITDALIARFRAGVPVRLIIEPNEYLNRKWPEFWITHANLDKLYAAGIPIKQRAHDGLTHMKMLVTSRVATNASSNYAAAWQRDHNYFVPAATKPAIHGAMRNRFATMWGDGAGFRDFVPLPPDAPQPTAPPSGSVGLPTSPTLSWARAPFAVSYDVYVGTSPSALALRANVPAQLVNEPPATYSWMPPVPLQAGATYFWKVVARTNATGVNPSLVAESPVWSFSTSGTAPSCSFSLSATSASFGAAGGNGSVGITAPAGCAWSASSNAGFITVTGGSSGNGSGTTTFAVSQNTAAARSGTMTIAGQTFTVSQQGAAPPPPPPPGAPDPLMAIDGPGPGQTVREPMTIAGWAIDRGDQSGTGVDTIHVYAYPNPGSSAPPVFLGVAQYGLSRPDVAAAFGSARFTNSGYSLTPSAALARGLYQIVVFARSRVTGTFNQALAVVVMVETSGATGFLDTPVFNADVPTGFPIAGWALDSRSTSGTGVSTIHVYAYPNPGSGLPPIFLGVATYGISRPDVGAIFGARFTASGWSLNASNVPRGQYLIAAFPYDTVAGAFVAPLTTVVTVR